MEAVVLKVAGLAKLILGYAEETMAPAWSPAAVLVEEL